MKKKNMICMVLILLCLVSAGCSKNNTVNIKNSNTQNNANTVENTNNNDSSSDSSDEDTDSKSDISSMYCAALDSFMKLDEGLNGDMKYIAIDMETLEDISEKDKEEIMNYFSKYEVEVMAASFEDLKEKGLFDEDTLSLEGVLLSVHKIDKKSDKKVVIEGEKYRSGKGAIDVECTLIKNNNEWIVDKSDITGIS